MTELIQISKLDHEDALKKAAEVAYGIAEARSRNKSWEWVSRDEAMKMLNCKKSKFQKLRSEKKIIGTAGMNGMFHVPSMNAYLLREASDSID